MDVSTRSPLLSNAIFKSVIKSKYSCQNTLCSPATRDPRKRHPPGGLTREGRFCFCFYTRGFTGEAKNQKTVPKLCHVYRILTGGVSRPGSVRTDPEGVWVVGGFVC